MTIGLSSKLGAGLRALRDLAEFPRLPRTTVHLMAERAQANHPFYAWLVEDFLADTAQPHPKLPFVRRLEYGVALCELPGSFAAYFGSLPGSARRNWRKAVRLGHAVRRFDYNSALDDVREIWRSAPVRQGPLPPAVKEGVVVPSSDPPSLDPCHDFAYYGAFQEGRLRAYAACRIMGEFCDLCEIYGHADYERDAVVPLLIIEVARELYLRHPAVRHYGYGTYFGASDSLRRFKRKFGFKPHHVRWLREGPC